MKRLTVKAVRKALADWTGPVRPTGVEQHWLGLYRQWLDDFWPDEDNEDELEMDWDAFMFAEYGRYDDYMSELDFELKTDQTIYLESIFGRFKAPVNNEILNAIEFDLEERCTKPLRGG